MALSKSKILAAKDVKTKSIDVPEWGGEVLIKTLSGLERDAFEDAYAKEDTKNFRARFLAMAICDEKGERLFTDDEFSELGKKSAEVIHRLFEQAWAFSAFRQEDAEALGKDSKSDQSEDSTSN